MSGIIAKYIGNGSYYQGVPARDLEDGDWARLSETQREWVRVGDLYEMVSAKAENQVASLQVSKKAKGKRKIPRGTSE